MIRAALFAFALSTTGVVAQEAAPEGEQPPTANAEAAAAAAEQGVTGFVPLVAPALGAVAAAVGLAAAGGGGSSTTTTSTVSTN